MAAADSSPPGGPRPGRPGPQDRGAVHWATLLRKASRAGVRQWAGFVGRNWARVSYGRLVEPTWLETTRHEVAVRDLPPEFRGFRIVHLTDLHAGRAMPWSYLHEVVALANSHQPDLVAVTGDFIHKGYKAVDKVAVAVGELTATHGVLAVLGNHDFAVRNALGFRRYRRLHLAVQTALAARGVRVLRNENWVLRRGAAELHVAGVDDLWSGVCDPHRALDGQRADVPRVLLAHNPRTVEHLGGHRADLVLSGHTHGGQVNWPGVGRILLNRNGRRFAEGWYRYQNSYLYVNRGVGFGFRFRFGVRPELAVMELFPAVPPQPERSPPPADGQPP
jgi:hypothetical protein